MNHEYDTQAFDVRGRYQIAIYYTVIEKAIFYSAFIIMKLIDCKGKVSDEVDTLFIQRKGGNYRYEIYSRS